MEKMTTINPALPVGPSISFNTNLIQTVQPYTNFPCLQTYLGNKRDLNLAPVSWTESNWLTANFQGRLYFHTPLVCNLASDKSRVVTNTRNLLIREIGLCRTYHLPSACVLHVGSHVKLTRQQGLGQVLTQLNQLALEGYLEPWLASQPYPLLLENAAGQGTELGTSVEELRWIFERLDTTRIGLCYDTCHGFAAGVSQQDHEQAIDKLLDELLDLSGRRFRLIHLNDSMQDFNSRVDRHQNLGLGYIWSDHDKLRGLSHLLDCLKVEGLDAVLETPNSVEGAFWLHQAKQSA